MKYQYRPKPPDTLIQVKSIAMLAMRTMKLSMMCRARHGKKIAKEYFCMALEGDFSSDAALIAHLRAQIGDLKRTLARSRDLLIESKRLVGLAVEIKNPRIDPPNAGTR